MKKLTNKQKWVKAHKAAVCPTCGSKKTKCVEWRDILNGDAFTFYCQPCDNYWGIDFHVFEVEAGDWKGLVGSTGSSS